MWFLMLSSALVRISSVYELLIASIYRICEAAELMVNMLSITILREGPR